MGVNADPLEEQRGIYRGGNDRNNVVVSQNKITGGNAHLVSALYRTYEDTVFIALCYFHDSGLIQIKFWF